MLLLLAKFGSIRGQCISRGKENLLLHTKVYLELMRTATNMNDSGSIHSEQRFCSVKKFSLPDSLDSFTDFIFGVTSNLIQLFPFFGCSNVATGSLFGYKHRR